jgi:hypothetical protein
VAVPFDSEIVPVALLKNVKFPLNVMGPSTFNKPLLPKVDAPAKLIVVPPDKFMVSLLKTCGFPAAKELLPDAFQVPLLTKVLPTPPVVINILPVITPKFVRAMLPLVAVALSA